MKAGPARLLFPALRWDHGTGFTHEAPLIEQALRRGVGGFSLFGGDAAEVLDLTTTTQSRCDYALLFGSDLERGAGQQFAGATPLPPLGAIGQLDDDSLTRRAGELTAREARALGVNWIYAPNADVDLEARNPIVGTRSFGPDAHRVAGQVGAWVEGCRAGGALSCAKHFPGHGRTTQDSHAVLPRVAAGRRSLETDLEPFRAAIAAGVDSIMTAHVVYDAIDADNPATLSAPILLQLLRDELRFDGVVVTDALNMQGVLAAAGGNAGHAAIRALNAGCNAILYPADLAQIAEALQAELGRTLSATRVAESIERIRAMAERGIGDATGNICATADTQWSLQTAIDTVVSLRATVDLPRSFDLLTIDDDLGGPFPAPARDSFRNALHEQGFDVHDAETANAERAAVIAVYSDIRAWKGAPGITTDARAKVAAAVAARGDAVVALFGHPRLADELEGRALFAAWGGEPLMQRAAAHWLALATGRHA